MRETFSRIEKSDSNNVHVVEMNADNMGFQDCSFDFILCGFMGWDYCFDFVLGEFTHPDTRMKEIWRVLRDGGWIGISAWERQSDLEWMEESFVRTFPSILSDDEFMERRPIGYSKENPQGYNAILISAGFRDIKTFTEEVEFVSTDEEEWWGQMRDLGWYRFFEKIENEGTETLQRIKQDIFKELQRHKRVDGLHFTKVVSIVFGLK